MRLRACLALVMVLTGCVSNTQPLVVYEGVRPLEDTAVFVAQPGAKSFQGYRAGVHRIDGKNAVPFIVDFNMGYGSVRWVRVLPGTHTFRLYYQTNSGIGGQYYFTYSTLKVEDMKPRHVYMAKYKIVGEYLHVGYEDLGEDPDFYLFDNPKYRASFISEPSKSTSQEKKSSDPQSIE